MKKSNLHQFQLIVFLTFAVNSFSIACTCPYYEPVFCKVVNIGYNVVRAVVTGHPESYLMEVNIIENINKEITEDTIVIYGQDGMNCGEVLSQFKIQDTLILAIGEAEVYGGITYWQLGGTCGQQFLRYENGMVIGQITDTLTSQPLQTFKDNLLECLDYGTPVEEITALGQKLKIFPIPVSDILQISVEHQPILAFTVFNSNGQQIIHKDLKRISYSHGLNTGDLIRGIYFLQIRTPQGILTRKFFKYS